MIKIRKIMFFVFVMTLLMTNAVYAHQWDWQMVPGHHNQSVLLEEGVLYAEDRVFHYGRGDYLAEGFVQIVNMEDGTLRIDASTLAHVNVDKIIQTVFLDMWSDEREDWINIEHWDYEITKEEVEDEELYMLDTSFIHSGCQIGKYYRLRGLHGVEIYDELEACATETNGVLLTDLWN